MRLGPREKRLLLGLLGVLGLALVVRSANDGGAQGPPGAVREVAAAAAGDAAPVRDVVALDVAALQPKSNRFELGRDPFNFVPDPPPPPPPTPTPAPTPRPFVGPLQPPPPPVPQPPSADHLHYLGSFGPSDNRIASIMASGQLYNVHQGEVLEGKFIVQEIGYESVAIGFVGFPSAPPRRLAAGAPGGH